MTISTYPGSKRSLTNTITDANGALYDPDQVKVHIVTASGDDFEYTYTGVDTANIVRVSTGVYVVTFYIPYTAASQMYSGIWNIDWQALDLDGTLLPVETEPYQLDVSRLGTLS